MNLHHKKRSLLDNLVYTSPRKKEPIKKYNIEPLSMNDLQQITEGITKPEQLLKPINHIQQIVSDISKPEQKIQPINHIQEVALTDRDGLDRAYKSDNDIAIIGDTLYIAGTKKERLSDWYDNFIKIPTIWNAVPFISQYKSIMAGAQMLPYLGEILGKADAAVPYVSAGLKAVPLVAPELAPMAIEADESLPAVSLGLQAAPFMTKGASYIANKVDNVLPFGSFGDTTTSSRYITAEKALKENPNIKRVVGDSQGGSIALELQKNHPVLMSRTYNAPVFDLKGLTPFSDNSKVERYRNSGDIVSALDSSAHITPGTKYTDKISKTHQYENIAENFKPS